MAKTAGSDERPSLDVVKGVTSEEDAAGAITVGSIDGYHLRDALEGALVNLLLHTREKQENPARARWRFLQEHACFIATRTPPLVRAKVEILHVWGVDFKAESFSVEVRVYCEWNCPEVDKKDALENGTDRLDVDWSPQWVPRLTLRNSMALLNDFPPKHIAWEQGEQVIIRGTYRWACQIHDSFDLHDFPFDIQDLSVRLQVENAPAFEVTALSTDSIQVFQSANAIPDLESLKAMPFMYRAVSSEIIEEDDLTRDNLANLIHVVLWYQRTCSYYIWNDLALMFAVTSCACTSWSLHWRAVADRLSIDITLLLVAVAFKQVTAQDLPPIPYLTFTERYALLGIFFLILATFMHAALGFMMWDCDVYGFCEYYEHLQLGMVEAGQVDNVMLIIWILFWMLCNAYKISQVYMILDRNARVVDAENVKKHGFEIGSLTKRDLNEKQLEVPNLKLPQRIQKVFCNTPLLAISTIVGIGISALLIQQVLKNSDHVSAAPLPVFKLPD